MKPKIKTISAEDLKKFLEKDGLLFTSQDLAKMLGVTEGALRKQRSKNILSGRYCYGNNT